MTIFSFFIFGLLVDVLNSREWSARVATLVCVPDLEVSCEDIKTHALLRSEQVLPLIFRRVPSFTHVLQNALLVAVSGY